MKEELAKSNALEACADHFAAMAWSVHFAMAALACSVAALACSIDSKAALANPDSKGTLPNLDSFPDSEKNAMNNFFVNECPNLIHGNFLQTQICPIPLWKTRCYFSGGVGVIPSLSGPVRALFSLLRLLAALGRS